MSEIKAGDHIRLTTDVNRTVVSSDKNGAQLWKLEFRASKGAIFAVFDRYFDLVKVQIKDAKTGSPMFGVCLTPDLYERVDDDARD